MAATVVLPTKPRLSREGGGSLGDASRVIVLNDEHNTFDGVARALSAVLPGVGYEQGMRFANEIHSRGQAIVFAGMLEHAELYWELLQARGLTMAPLER
ncbi:MAG: ATP-dependent Clp protease adaptor ClpS [Gaiellaceae bacterium]